MSRKVTSFRLSELAARQLGELTTAFKMNNSEVISHAIDRMYRQEFGNGINPMKQETQTMNEQIAIADGTFTPQELARLVAEASARGEWYDGPNSTNIEDWIAEGDYDGSETIASLAAEWDA